MKKLSQKPGMKDVYRKAIVRALRLYEKSEFNDNRARMLASHFDWKMNYCKS